MAKFTPLMIICFIFILMFFVSSVNSWDGNVCTRKVVKYSVSYYCSCKRLWWCCGRSARNNPYYKLENICCPGWEHNGDQNCSIPICVPQCRNGGKCVKPNTCDCAAGFDGDICDGTAACSHLDPCYPGRCLDKNATSNATDVTTTVSTVLASTITTANDTNITESDTCKCSDGFGGPSCLLFAQEFKPVIEQSNATFTRLKIKADSKHETLSEYQIDVSEKSGIDVTWTNTPQFTKIQCFIHSTFEPDYIFGYMPNLPNYIRNTSFGIVEAHFEVLHIKLHLEGGTYVANRINLKCEEPGRDNPVEVLRCDKIDQYDITLSSGDIYSLKFKVTSGGFRTLVNTDTDNVTGTDYYVGPTSINEIEFRFDYEVPIHCSANNSADDSCTDASAMTLEEDITMTAIKPKWSGWIDSISGVLRYAFEVWELGYSIDENGLKEPEIKSEYNPKPLFINDTTADNLHFPMYEPMKPGVYSCILEINDRANNSEYVRRIAIYDRTTEINISTTEHLYISSALGDTDYKWQTTYYEDNITEIYIRWDDHFFNEVHEKGNFLAKVLKYQARLSEVNNPNRQNYKRIVDKFDDHEGARQKEAITNIHAIVKFEIVHESITKQRQEPSETRVWTTVSPLKENEMIELPKHTVSDGYAVQVWVKAYDIMNHTKVDTTVVRFDKSKPDLYEPDIDFNIDNSLKSRLKIRSRDEHSGVKKLSIQFVLNSTGEVRIPINDYLVPKKTSTQCPQGTDPDCYCIQDDCFKEIFEFPFSNCDLTVPVDAIHNTYTVYVTAYNHAMLNSSVVKEIGKVEQFSGIEQYSSPLSVKFERSTETTITVSWKLKPSCYERVRNVIVITGQNTTKTLPVDKDATEHVIPDLNPDIQYKIQMYSDYGNESDYVQSSYSEMVSGGTQPMPFKFPQWGFYTIGGGFVFILIIVVTTFLILGRMGKLNKVKKRMTKRISQLRNTWYDFRNGDAQPKQSRNNRAVSRFIDNDVTFFGGMEFEGEQHWHIKQRNLSLEEEIARGRFAIIFKAKLYTSRNLEEIVVAKTVHEDSTEDDRIQMKAKIHFYATKVGHHVNVLEFKGSCEHDSRGSIMVLEYCKNGTLKEYLDSVRECFNSEISDKLARIAYSICLGMDYLASKEIVHRRLAARNVLLNHLYEPKIYGFGPNPEEIGTNVNEIKETVPVKWVAPEVMVSSINATELSDAWSYGIVLWEIFSLGESPYPGINSNDVYKYLRDGERMAKPEYCDQMFYNVMKKCWQYDHKKRFGFAKLKDQLRPLFHDGEDGDDIYLQLIRDQVEEIQQCDPKK